MFGVILAAVDEFGRSDAVVKVVHDVALMTHDKVVVVHVFPLHTQRPAGPSTYETPEEAEQMVDKFVKLFKENGIEAEGVVERHAGGGIGRAVLEIGHQHNVGLVVVGTHRRSEMVEVVLGSVSHEVLRGATVPVLVVPNIKE
jgi:nucleotide-binding universal stress UspA family protein